jgi:uncharacterized protein with HEPN domain
MTERLQKHLLDALEAAQDVLEFVGDADAAQYASNRMLRAAVERQLMVVGEASRRALDTEPGLRERVPDLVFAVGLRNRLVHGYDTVDDEIVHDTIRSDLPGLIAALRALLDGEAEV